MLAEDVSSNEIAGDMVGFAPKGSADSSVSQTVSLDVINELELQVAVSDKEDLREVSKILFAILDYPVSEMAESHSKAMKLGNYDMEQPEEKVKARVDTSLDLMEGQKPEFCPCCGFVKQQDSIKMCTSLDGIKNMGLSTYLFFSVFKNLAILLLISLLVYSGFALVTNVMASKNANTALQSLDYIVISLSAKQTNNTETNRLYYFISCWLGIGMILLWILALVGIKYKESKDSLDYDVDTISCSDYTIVVEGLPVDVQKEELQTQFNQYYETTIKNNHRIPDVWKQPLTIAKVNVGKPFYMSESALKDEELDKINEEMAEIKETLVGWIKERQGAGRFSTPKAQRESAYDRYSKLSTRRIEKILELSLKIKTMLKLEETHELTTAFVTFESNNSKTVMDHLHQSGLAGRLKGFFNDDFKRFRFKRGDSDFSLAIQRAPEPEDIIWQNIGHKDCAVYLRKFLTYFATALLLGLSFAIVFGLTKAQESAGDNRYISIGISATIAIINVLLITIIKALTYYEKDYTSTHREASLAVKSIIAQMINSIVIPVITAYEIKQNVYFVTGLVDNVFMLGVSTAIMPPILVFIDPYNLYMKAVRCFKSSPGSKLSQTQKEHNTLHEGIEFELGYHYIYVANTFLFSCFFMSLQPIVVAFSLLGFFLMYWSQKYCIFNRYRRPVPGTDFVSKAVHRIIMLGPLIYSMGSLTWSNLSPVGIPDEALLPNIIAVGISVLMLFFPIHSIIIGACFSQEFETVKKFDDERLLFPSEYDRLNPSTQEEGLAEYKKYMERKMVQLKKCSTEKQTEMAHLMNVNAQRAQRMNKRTMNVEMQGALGNLFGVQNQGMAMGMMGGMGMPMGMGQQPMMGMFPGMQPQQGQPNFMNFMMPPVPVQQAQAQAPVFMMPPPQPPPIQMVPHGLSRGPAPVAGYPPMNQVPGGQFVNPQAPGFNIAVTPPPAMGMAMSNQNPLNMLNMGAMNPAPNPHAMHGMIPRSSNNHNPQRRM